MIRSASRAILALVVSASATGAWAGGDPFLADAPPPGAYVDLAAVDVVTVTIDFAKLLLLERPARTVVIGNTAIADANLSDDRTIVLTGRTAGYTNLIVLDADGVEISNVLLEVVTGGPNLVTVHQGMRRQTFTCGRRCEPLLSVGDEAEFFSTTAEQINARQEFANSGATP